MKIKINTSILLLCFWIGNANAQSYYPKLNNLFLENEGSESVFTPETEFFRLELRENFNKLFYGDLQTSNGGSRTSASAFYSMKIIPRFVFETEFFDSNIYLKFNVENDKSKFPSFPIICNEYNAITDDDKKEGKGDMTTDLGAISLQFSDKLFDSGTKGVKSEFLVERIQYTYKNNIFDVELLGSFTTDVKLKKTKLQKNTEQKIKLRIENKTVTFFVITNAKELEFFKKTVTP